MEHIEIESRVEISENVTRARRSGDLGRALVHICVYQGANVTLTQA